MHAVTQNPVDIILAAAFLSPWIIAGIAALFMRDDR